MPRKRKTMTMVDLKNQSSANEYYAGGLSEDGGGSATVLLYPGEEEFDSANSTANASCEEAPAEPAKRAFEGTGRSLKD